MAGAGDRSQEAGVRSQFSWAAMVSMVAAAIAINISSIAFN